MQGLKFEASDQPTYLKAWFCLPCADFLSLIGPLGPISVLQGALGKPAFLSAFTFGGRPSEEEKFLFAWRQMSLKFLCCKWVSRWRLYTRLAMPLAGISVVRKTEEEHQLKLQLERILIKLFNPGPSLNRWGNQGPEMLCLPQESYLTFKAFWI